MTLVIPKNRHGYTTDRDGRRRRLTQCPRCRRMEREFRNFDGGDGTHVWRCFYCQLEWRVPKLKRGEAQP